MNTRDIRTQYLEFYKKNGHSIVPSSSIMPENDPTTLFTGSGMQPMIPYLLGAKHPLGARIANSQKSFRAQDIEEVGDNRHTTFFEMLGNWSFGDYFKQDQIQWIFSFLIDVIGLDPSKIYATVFRGNKDINIPKDEESAKIWEQVFRTYGIEARAVDFSEKQGMQNGRIFFYDELKNWWSRSGIPKNMPIGEPGGPDSEMFWDFGAHLKQHENSQWKNVPCHVNCDCGRFLEIGNSVFMEYIKTRNGFEPLAQKNVDFGGGLERIAAAKLDNPDIFHIDIFQSVIEKLEKISGKSYQGNDKKSFRVIADHIRAAIFILSDPRQISPSNTDQGYIVRRLIRRAVRYGKQLGINKHIWTAEIANEIINSYQQTYAEMEDNIGFALNTLQNEEEKFNATLEKGLKMFFNLTKKNNSLSSSQAFDLYQTYGFPKEMTRELCDEKGISFDENAFEKETKKHQELSRTAAAEKFKGGLADTNSETTRLHTATHLLNEALRKILKDDTIKQRGSNITQERLRFDFNFSRKLTPQEIESIEKLINEKIREQIPVSKIAMPLAEALFSGAQSEFGARYPDIVTVYSIGGFSKEICGGPHVANTCELGYFKIIKEESCGAGVRRIKAVLKEY